MSAPPRDSEPPSAPCPQDERLWPIQLALSLWAVLLAVAVWGLGGFDDPRLLENGWTRMIAIGVTLAAIIWATRTVYPRRARRLKLAVIISLATHTLLMMLLYSQHLEYHLEPLDAEPPLAENQPVAEPVDKFTVEYRSDSPGREAFELPIATDSPSPERIELPWRTATPIELDPPTVPPDKFISRRQLVPQPMRLRRRQDALARAAQTPAQLSHREPAIASLPDTVAIDPPRHVDARSTVATQPVRQAPAIPTPRTAASRLAPQVIASLPELPAPAATQDLPRQRTADPSATIALDSSRARSRRRVEAAPLPEMPSETERLADQTATHATRPVDAQAHSPLRANDSAEPNAAATAGVADPDTTRFARTAKDGLARAVTNIPAGLPFEAGTPDTQSSGRLFTQTLRRRRSADADPGLRSGGGLDRPRRSRGPSPAAPVLAPLPTFATSRQQDGKHPEGRGPQLPVIVDAPAERGGLGSLPANKAGLTDRLAARDSDLIHLSPAERNNRRGGEPTSSRPTRQPASAYALRVRRSRTANRAGSGRPSTKTEAAVELGVAFLSRVQLEDGRWEFQYLGHQADSQETDRIIIEADAAATGLALLAFLGAGYDHFGGPHQHAVQNGLDYLVRVQAPSGELFPERDQPVGHVTRFYGHGIATLALCEAYGMTGDPQIKQPAQAAIDYLIATQHAELGGWRYVPGTNADLSVSGWQLMALKGGDLAGLAVRADAYQRLRALLERCREVDAPQARFRYNPWASASDPRTRHGLQPSTVMTSVGMLMQLHLNDHASDKRLQRGADHLLANLPQLGGAATIAPTGTLDNPQRDTYYWYYATQVMYRLGGSYWQAWNDRLHPLLVTSQTTAGPLAGSWDPHRPVPDKWANYGGRLYVTALNLLSLEVQYRHLPLDKLSPTRIAERPE